MSDISILSNQYNKMVDTSSKINDSVIVYKKVSLLRNKINHQKFPQLSITADEIKSARITLLSFLENIQALKKGEQVQSDFIPSLIVNDYKNKLNENVYLEEDLNTMLSKLRNDQMIDDDAIIVLDNLLSLLDKERNALFRKLRRARG